MDKKRTASLPLNNFQPHAPKSSFGNFSIVESQFEDKKFKPVEQFRMSLAEVA
jgi:hypothetical protein